MSRWVPGVVNSNIEMTTINMKDDVITKGMNLIVNSRIARMEYLRTKHSDDVAVEYRRDKLLKKILRTVSKNSRKPFHNPTTDQTDKDNPSEAQNEIGKALNPVGVSKENIKKPTKHQTNIRLVLINTKKNKSKTMVIDRTKTTLQDLQEISIRKLNCGKHFNTYTTYGGRIIKQTSTEFLCDAEDDIEVLFSPDLPTKVIKVETLLQPEEANKEPKKEKKSKKDKKSKKSNKETDQDEGESAEEQTAKAREILHSRKRELFSSCEGRVTPRKEYNETLPIFEYKEQIVKTVKENIVTIIEGSTGSGKSTQVPQYLLEELCSESTGGVICCQPRRLAATSLASRVSQERIETVGHTVGHMVRWDVMCSDVHTRLLFATPGIVFNILSANPTLKNIHCIILDEIHERNAHVDIILTLLRHKMESNLLHPSFRLVCLSATVDTKLFENYFSGVVPTIRCHKRAFPVEMKYIKDAEMITGIKCWIPTPKGKLFNEDDDVMTKWINTNNMEIPHVANSDNIPYSLITKLVEKIHQNRANKKTCGILIFLPGIGEIEKAFSEIRKTVDNIVMFKLHGQMSIENQNKVYTSTRKTKVILATNVAETSITVPDVTEVIDTGYVKEMRLYGGETMFEVLQSHWVSKSSATQRAGRAGRVSAGTCWRLYEEKWFSSLPNFSIPEIQFSPLLIPVLQVAGVVDNTTEIRNILSCSPSPPSHHVLDMAITTLEQIGAIRNEKLTSLGSLLSILPVDPHVGKLLLLSGIVECSFIGCCTAAVMTSQTDILKRQTPEDHSNLNLRSDILSKGVTFAGYLLSDDKDRYIKENKLNWTALYEVIRLYNTYNCALQSLHLSSTEQTVNKRTVDLMKCCIVAGLYPRIGQCMRGVGHRVCLLSGQVIVIDRNSSNFEQTSPFEWISYETHRICGTIEHHKKIITSTTIGTSEMLLVFAGGSPLGITKTANGRRISFDRQLYFKCNSDDAAIFIRLLRYEVDALFSDICLSGNEHIRNITRPLVASYELLSNGVL